MDKMRQKNISLQTGEAVKCIVTHLAFNVSKAKIHFNVEQGLSMLSFMKEFFKAQSNLSAPNIVGHLWCGMAPFAVFLRHKRKKGGGGTIAFVGHNPVIEGTMGKSRLIGSSSAPPVSPPRFIPISSPSPSGRSPLSSSSTENKFT